MLVAAAASDRPPPSLPLAGRDPGACQRPSFADHQERFADRTANAEFGMEQPIIPWSLHQGTRGQPPNDLWLVHGKLYNLNPFVDDHPGGRRMISLGRGWDSTTLVESYHALADRQRIDQILAQHYVRDATAEEMPPESDRFDFGADSFYATLTRKVHSALPRRRSRETSGPLATALCLAGVAILLWAFALAQLLPSSLSTFWAPVWAALASALALSLLLGALHEASHGALLPRAPAANQLMSAIGTLLTGLSDVAYKTSHVASHHTLPNLPGADWDLEVWSPFLRKASHNEWHRWHVHQHLYAPLAYAFGMVVLAAMHTSELCSRLRHPATRLGPRPYQPALTPAEIVDLRIDLCLCVAHWMLFVASPLVVSVSSAAVAGARPFGAACVRGLLTLCAHKAVLGLAQALLFIGGHETSEMVATAQGGLGEPSLTTDGSAARPADWGVYQLSSTANVCGRVVSSSAARRLTGGIFCQVEHHLYPALSHVHFPAVRAAIAATAAQFGVEPLMAPPADGIVGAVREHLRLLRTLGQPGTILKTQQRRRADNPYAQ
jgi:fatty acid desaturase